MSSVGLHTPKGASGKQPLLTVWGILPMFEGCWSLENSLSTIFIPRITYEVILRYDKGELGCCRCDGTHFCAKNHSLVFRHRNPFLLHVWKDVGLVMTLSLLMRASSQ